MWSIGLHNGSIQDIDSTNQKQDYLPVLVVHFVWLDCFALYQSFAINLILVSCDFLYSTLSIVNNFGHAPLRFFFLFWVIIWYNQQKHHRITRFEHFLIDIIQILFRDWIQSTIDDIGRCKATTDIFQPTLRKFFDKRWPIIFFNGRWCFFVAVLCL